MNSARALHLSGLSGSSTQYSRLLLGTIQGTSCVSDGCSDA
jgi:hypothetical protein